MFRYILKRVLATIPVMGIVAIFVFLMLRLSPGDPAAVIAGDYATSDDIALIREKLGLADPIIVQFWRWIVQILSGDLGISIFTNLPVAYLIGQRIEPTLSLTLCTLLVSVLVAVPLGTIAAARAGTWIDRCVMGFSVLGFSLRRLDEWCQKICYDFETLNATFFRPYACTNTHEFFSVAIENFFERSVRFKAELPELYSILVTMLNQDPVLMNEKRNIE
jgi:hypothetical protein